MRTQWNRRNSGKWGSLAYLIEHLEERRLLTAVSVSGAAQWTDASGGTHAVPLSTVEIRSTAEMNTDPPLATCQTDINGNFSGSFNFSSNVTVFARIFARNPAADVKPDSATPTTYFMDSATQAVTAGGNVMLPTRVGSNTVVAEESFSVAAASLEAETYVTTLAIPLATMPSQLDVRYPSNTATNGSASFFRRATKQLFITQRRVYDWDIIQHEYGHYVQAIYQFVNSPGGGHSFQAANPKTGTVPGGEGLAWSEGWATFFAISAQRAVAAPYAAGVPNVGDTAYNPVGPPANTNPSYDLASETGVGELDEASVGSILYHLTAGDEGIKIDDKTLFQDFVSAKPTTLGAAWDAIAANMSGDKRSLLGKVFGLQNAAPVETGPADFAGAATSSIPTFTWQPNGSNDFLIQFYSSDFKTLLDQTVDLGNVNSFTPAADEWAKIFNGHSTVKWVVEGKDTTVPVTPGAAPDQTYGGMLDRYWSAARTLNGPSISLVIDNTGSMSPEIGAVQSALDQFISDLQASLLPGDTAPTVDLVTFVDGPTEVISSNDLTAVKAAVDAMSAGGGGDCPEPSAASLQFAAQNVGPGGTMLLITDASSDPGSDLSGTIASLRAKGVRVNAFISGDCSNVDEPTDASPAAFATPLTATALAESSATCNCNGEQNTAAPPAGSTASAQPAVTAAISVAAAPVVTASTTSSGAPAAPLDTASQTDDGPEPAQGPITDAGQTPVDFGGNSTSTATRLTVDATPVSGVIGQQVVDLSGATTTNTDDFYVVTLNAGTAYNIPVMTTGASSISATLLASDGMTALQTASTAFSDLGIESLSIAFTPTITGDYFIHVGQPDSQTGYTIQASDNPIVGTQSSVVLFSTVAGQTGGEFLFKPAIANSADPSVVTDYQSSIRNVMDSTFEPAVLSATPNLLPQGTKLNVMLTGRGTNWIQGTTTVSFSDSQISVTSVTVNSPTTLTASVTVPGNATLGFSDVTVKTPLGSKIETAVGSNALQVSAAPLTSTLLQVQPGVLTRGKTVNVTVLGSGTSWNSGSALSLGPGLTVSNVSVVSPTQITAQVRVTSGAQIGFRVATVTTGSSASDTQDMAVTVGSAPLAAVPAIAGVTPSQIAFGQSADVSVTGSNTNFVNSVTTASFGAGVTVDSVTVSDATHAVIHVDAAPGASAGFRNVTVTTGSEVAALINGFLVEPTLVTNTLLLTDSKGPSSLAVVGRGSVTATGVGQIFVNSSSRAAVSALGHASASAFAFNVVGKIVKGSHLTGTVNTGQPAEAVPVNLTPPAAPATVFKAVRDFKSTPLTLQPGTYVGGITLSGRASVTMAPGLYYMQGGGFSVLGRATVTGNGVTIYLGARRTGGVIISGSASLTAMTSGPLAGVVFYQDPADHAPVVVTGTLAISGIFYAASARLVVAGVGSFTDNADGANNISALSIFSDVTISGAGRLTVDTGQ
jgi:hypothetical protein